MGAWPKVQIVDVADLIRGVTYAKDDARSAQEDGYLPVLRATNIQESRLVLESDLVFVPKGNVSANQTLRAGDIVVATSSGSKHLVGKSALLGHEWGGSFGAFCAAIRPKGIIEPRYLASFLQSPAYWKQIGEKSMGVNINNLRRGDIESVTLPLPDLDEQRRIVAEIETQFSRLDEAVANLQRVKANLKRYKAAVLKAAVEGRLVETEASLAHREGRSYETGEQLLQRILEARRSQWAGRGKYKEPAAEPSYGHADSPEGWSHASVESLSSHVEYGSSAKTNEDPSGVPVLRMGNIFEGDLIFDSLKYLPADHDEFPKLLVEPGDLLFNRTNSPELVGKTAVFKSRPQPFSFASYLIRVRLVKDGALPEYLAAYINSLYGRQWVKSVVTQQVGQANVNGTKLQALMIPLPPLEEQRRIVDELDLRLSILRGVEAEVDANLLRAQVLRQSVLTSFLGGNNGQANSFLSG